jgi:hypothetical protein
MTLLQEALAPKSDQLNADDLISGPRTIKITGARFIEGDRGQKRVVVHYEGENGRPFKPCKTMGRAMVMVWHIVDDDDPAKVSEQFVGKSITVYRDPEVIFGDQGKVGGIRISHMSHITEPKTVTLTITRGRKAKFVFQPLVAEVKQHPTADPKPQTAADWAEAHRAEVLKSASADELAQLKAKSARIVAKLAATDADLHSRVMEACELRAQELAEPTPDRGDEAFWEQGEQA